MISVSIIEDDPSVRTILEGWVSDAQGSLLRRRPRQRRPRPGPDTIGEA